MAGVLRQVLRGLVASRRRDPSLASWKREHLLFICTHKYRTFRFAYFRSKPDNPNAARLATFGWQPESHYRTLVEFNLPALVWPDDPEDADAWVAQWAKAFDKEPLTKDFFRRFDRALEQIKADLETHQKMSSAEAYTASQLLLERLIFLYFLQNRGWLNRNASYLREELTNHQDGQTFTYYREFLDKLFWTLSTAPRTAGNRFPGIPFLNGGLFDDDEFRQPADTRKVSPPLKVRNATMRFVFDELLEAFNFTVTEDTPLSQEVAVDPEMLGKVFESIVLHAEAADEDANAPDKRKGTGSYYTPRIVVHFICREALYQYLRNHLPGQGWEERLRTMLELDATDGFDDQKLKLLRATITPEDAGVVLEAIKPLRCCDPAVGSGAFPVGLMQELVNLRRVLETAARGKDPVHSDGHKWLHEAKAHVVENCLFGVDIQQQAVEICRLRLWLSLIVDYDLGVDPFDCNPKEFNQAIDGISQLPNLEMNFRRGDSLHDHICGVPVVILPERSMRHFDAFKAIGDLGTELHKAKKSDKKRRLRVEILQARLALTQNMLDEEKARLLMDDSALDGLFGIEDSKAKKRERNQRELENLNRALSQIQRDSRALEKLKERQYDNDFYSKLRKLEGADFDSPFNFAWHIDFPNVFAIESGGFDIVVGNPPFVTARNPEKRKLWAGRWPRVCFKNYQLVAPFVEVSFDLLRARGQLGFIVSNAFAKRDFGEPLVTRMIAAIDLQKVIDCSGLLFPGHGTPTCLFFGANPGLKSAPNKTRITTILPGGGDLKAAPEDSVLWQSIRAYHDSPGFEDRLIRVSDHSKAEVCHWPWNFLSQENGIALGTKALKSYCAEPIGAQFITGKDEAYVVSADYVRRLGVSKSFAKPYGSGEDIRNWEIRSVDMILYPYAKDLSPLPEPLPTGLNTHLRPLRAILENCVISGSIKKKETKLCWFEYRRLARRKLKAAVNLLVPHIATHQHFVVAGHEIVFKEKVMAIVLQSKHERQDYILLCGLLNSSTATWKLKQSCFNKGAGQDEHRDRYEFAGNKLEEFDICPDVCNALDGDSNNVCKSLLSLAERNIRRGQELADMSFRRMFSAESRDFICEAVISKNRQERDEVRQEMIATQEELDWLAYGMYGLVDPNEFRIELDPMPLSEDLRVFRLWIRAGCNYGAAIKLIPSTFDANRRVLWEKRLLAIRDNDQVRAVEQPVYKRRWDEQWKVSNEWRCGEIAYAAEFMDAFQWWLMEKAEYWMENPNKAKPASRADWCLAIWQDERVKAAWTVAAEQYAYLENEKAREKGEADGDPAPAPKQPDSSFRAFERLFKRLIDDESVPAGFEFGTPYDELAKKLKKPIPAKLQRVRGKLNVPRERFHEIEKDVYQWAGLQFRTGAPRGTTGSRG